MTNKLFPLAALLLLAPPASAAAPPAAPSFGETVEVNVVNVDVFVTDKDGRRVTGLKKGDFEVQEDGKTMAVSNFAELLPRLVDGRPGDRPRPARGAGGAHGGDRRRPRSRSRRSPAAALAGGVRGQPPHPAGAPHAGRGADPQVPGPERPAGGPRPDRELRQQPPRPPPLHRRRGRRRRDAARDRAPPHLRPAGGRGAADGLPVDGRPRRHDQVQQGHDPARGGVRRPDARRGRAYDRGADGGDQLPLGGPRPPGPPLRQRRHLGHPRRGGSTRRPASCATARTTAPRPPPETSCR